MKLKGLTQVELARASEISQSTISNYLQGKRRPGADELCALSRTLKVPMEELLYGERGTWFSEEQKDCAAAALLARIARRRQQTVPERLLELAARQGKLISEQRAIECAISTLAAELADKYPPHTEANLELNEK